MVDEKNPFDLSDEAAAATEEAELDRTGASVEAEVAAERESAEAADRAKIFDEFYDRLLSGLTSMKSNEHVEFVNGDNPQIGRWINARSPATKRQVSFEFRRDGYIYVLQLSDSRGNQIHADAPSKTIDPLQATDAEGAIKRVLRWLWETDRPSPSD